MTTDSKWVLVSKRARRVAYFDTKTLALVTNYWVDEYYTGEKPARQIKDAKMFDAWYKAKTVQKYSHTGDQYRPMKVTSKQIFEMTLKGL